MTKSNRLSNILFYRERQTELTSELERIQSELHEAKADRKQNERETKFTEAVESLKRLFSGVYGRLTDLAKISKKYRLAVTVAAGGSIDAIIVEDEKTALECIRVNTIYLISILIYLNSILRIKE